MTVPASTFLWTGDALVEALGGRPIGDMPRGVTGIAIDSRALSPGDAFFAIKGDRFDGHDFASPAMANGAAVLVVSEARLPALGRLQAPMIVVDDVLEALERLGVAARTRTSARIVAVTGSVGKTTTKSMLSHGLAACGRVHAAVASFNNHWGVPLTLARMPQDAEYGIFEIGMNHPGEITPLVAMVRPHVAIVTTIAAAHLGSFASLDAIAMAKAEIFSGIEPGGYALIHRDVEQHRLLAREAKRAGVAHIVSFGENPDSDLRLEDYVPLESGGRISVVLGDRSIEARIGVPGRHIAQNAVAVFGTAALVGADVDKVAGALASYRSEKGRGARHVLQVDGGTVLLIDESYNANPASMRAALELLAGAKPGDNGRRIAVLGDMLELGTQSQALHAELSRPVIDSGAQVVHLAGPEMVALKAALPKNLTVTHHSGAADLASSLVAGVRAGDVVMVKSSNGIGFGAVVAALLDKFPALTDSEPTDPVDPMDAKDNNPC